MGGSSGAAPFEAAQRARAQAKAMSPPRRRARSPLGRPAALAMWPPKDLEAARRPADEEARLLLLAASGASSSGRSKK